MLWLAVGMISTPLAMAHGQDTAPTTEPPADATSQPEIPAISNVTGILTPKGTLVIEPSVVLSHTSINRVILEGYTVIPAITVGSIDIRQVDRDVVTAAMTARYGVTDRFEFDLKVPMVYRYDSLTTRPLGMGADADIISDTEGAGLGDVEIGLHYQMNEGAGGSPFYVANLRIKSDTGTDPFEVPLDADGLETELPTGTGFWSLEPSLTVLFPSDPAVFFANAGYLWNIERDVGGTYGTIDPGDALRFSVGMGYGINEKSSFSLGYEHSVIMRSQQDGQDIAGTDLQIGSLLLGWSYRISEKTSYNLTIGIGATDEAPDAKIELRIPIRYDLF